MDNGGRSAVTAGRRRYAGDRRLRHLPTRAPAEPRTSATPWIWHAPRATPSSGSGCTSRRSRSSTSSPRSSGCTRWRSRTPSRHIERPKLEMYDDCAVRGPEPVEYEAESDVVTTGEVMVFIGDAYVVTVRHGECSPLAQVRRRLEEDRDAAARADGRALLDRRRHGRPLPGGDRAPDGPGGAGGGGLLAERRRFTAHRIQDLHVKRQILEFRRAAVS